MASWMPVEPGDLLTLGISLCLSVFLVSLVWSLVSDRQSAPPF